MNVHRLKFVLENARFAVKLESTQYLDDKLASFTISYDSQPWMMTSLASQEALFQKQTTTQKSYSYQPNLCFIRRPNPCCLN